MTYAELNRKPANGQLVCVLHTHDRKWYRGRIEEHRPDKVVALVSVQEVVFSKN